MTQTQELWKSRGSAWRESKQEENTYIKQTKSRGVRVVPIVGPPIVGGHPSSPV